MVWDGDVVIPSKKDRKFGQNAAALLAMELHLARVVPAGQQVAYQVLIFSPFKDVRCIRFRVLVLDKLQYDRSYAGEDLEKYGTICCKTAQRHETTQRALMDSLPAVEPKASNSASVVDLCCPYLAVPDVFHVCSLLLCLSISSLFFLSLSLFRVAFKLCMSSEACPSFCPLPSSISIAHPPVQASVLRTSTSPAKWS